VGAAFSRSVQRTLPAARRWRIVGARTLTLQSPPPRLCKDDAMPRNPTACLLVIGNEVLSGRTQDANIRFLATKLGELGIPLREVRIIPDVAQTIIDTVNEVRRKFDYVFTTGGIGPTHDDITSECIAAAFGVPWEPHPVAFARMAKAYKPGEFNAARQRMGTMPRGAQLIDNAMSVAPGFQMENVYVMAGVPRVMQSMFEWLAPRLQGGQKIESRAVHAISMPEGLIAEGLSTIQARYPDIDLGSYPFYRATGNGVTLVAKGTSAAEAEAVIAEVMALITSLGRVPIPGEPAE
jgi:molybdenum cofactor synthesis domain-containing protein